MAMFTGVDLSKILGEKQNIGGEQMVSITDEYMGISQLLGHVPGFPSKSRPVVMYRCMSIEASRSRIMVVEKLIDRFAEMKAWR